MRKSIIIALSASVTLAACANMNREQQGTLIGGIGGAAVGAAVSDGSIWGVLAGAAIGGLAGNRIGAHMDEQAKELEQAVPTAEVNRVGEGINMTFPAALMFKINSAEISPQYRDDLAAAAEVFKRYPDTNILIEGHTDDTSTDEVNMRVSKARAESVSDFFVSQGVDPARLDEMWYGESQPKYPNDSEANRSKNRRVELAIYANEEMKQAAREGTL
ncbi:MAG: OmpA family protein [Gammaproteobacteria bacterium]